MKKLHVTVAKIKCLGANCNSCLYQIVNHVRTAVCTRRQVHSAEVDNVTTKEALEAIRQIAVQPTNQASEIDLFYNLKQGNFESISAVLISRVHIQWW